LSLKLPPTVNEVVPLQNSLEASRIERTLFDELEEAGFVLGASCLERDGCKVLGSEDADGHSFKIALYALLQCFFHQRRDGREELDRPATDDYIFALHCATSRYQMIEKRFWTDDELALLRSECDEHVQVQRVHWLKVKGSADCAANRVSVDNAVGLHSIDCCDGFLDVHLFEFESTAISRAALKRREESGQTRVLIGQD
jgi:hypothetical protein